MKWMGLRAKVISFVVISMIASISTVSLIMRDMVYDNIIDQKLTTSDVLTASLVHDIKYDFNSRDKIAIDNIVSKYLTYYRIIRDIHYYAVDETTISFMEPKYVTLISNMQGEMDSRIMDAFSKAKPSIQLRNLQNKELSISSIAPVLQGSKVIGVIDIDISIDDLNVLLRELNFQTFLVICGATLFAAIFMYALLRHLVLGRVSSIIDATQALASGDYEARVSDKSNDELGQLSRSFNQMTEDLNFSRKEIERHNQELDQKIQSATKELKVAYEDLKNAQGQIVLSEKMASLGVLIAGIAHEINTPIGAISNMSRNLESKVSDLPKLVCEIGESTTYNMQDIQDLLDVVVDCAFGNSQPSSFNVVRSMESLLKKAGVEDWRNIASGLASINFTNERQIQRYVELLSSPLVYQLVMTTGYIAHASKISSTSSRKIQDIIHALKFYAYTDLDKIESTCINESIRTSLVLVNNRIKYLVNLTTDFLDEDLVVACTSEVHQIWAVLLNNSIDAIEQRGSNHQGAIDIKTYKEDRYVCASVTDNGGGIPESIRDKIFDPFFTTKDIGKGTGLGLSIVTGIVEKHHGTIEAFVRGDKTTFVVKLPGQGMSSSLRECS